MTLTMACSLVIIGVFGGICLYLSARLDNANGRITILEIKANYSEQSEKTLRKSVDLQTKCIRDLNDIVKKSVEGKEPTKPDTKALISGWDADEQEEPELVSVEEFRKNIDSMACQRINPFAQQAIIDNMNCQNIYPWQPLQSGQLQSSAMPLQQCIYPWQQTPLGAMLPLWYINRRLEDM